MKSNIVILDWPEIIQGALEGVMRRVSSRKQGLNPNKTKSGFIWESDIIGSLGEMVFAKYANLYNSYSINSFKMPDIGTVQVRATQYDDGCLIIQKNDPDNDPYVLVTGECFEWKIRGWITGKQGKQREFFREDRGNYWVPIHELEDISTLPEAKR